MHLILLAAGKGSRLPRKYRLEPKCAVKICGKTLLEHNVNFYKKFRNRTIVTGYKSKKLNLFIKENKFKNIKNRYYSNTNMVYSLFKVHSIKSNNIVVCYSDIIFDKNIFNNLKKNYSNTIILLKKNWLKIWRGRMRYNKIKKVSPYQLQKIDEDKLIINPYLKTTEDNIIKEKKILDKNKTDIQIKKKLRREGIEPENKTLKNVLKKLN